MDDYEREIRERKERNQRLLAELGIKSAIAEVKSDDLLSPKASKKKSLGEKRKQRPAEPPAPSRVSLRVRGVDPEGRAAIIEKAQAEAEEAKQRAFESRLRRHGDYPLVHIKNFGKKVNSGEAEEAEDVDEVDSSVQDEQEADAGALLLQTVFSDKSSASKKAKLPAASAASSSSSSLPRYKALKPSESTKVTPERIISAAMFPCTDKTLALFGDKEGYVGLWDASASDQESTYLYRPHGSPVSCISFSNSPSTSMAYTCSYDGTVRGLDVDRSAFMELFVHPAVASGDSYEEAFYHVSVDSTDQMFYACDKYGLVHFVDKRKGKDAVWSLQFHDHKITTVHLRPSDELYLTTASLDNTAELWDIRLITPSSTKKAAKGSLFSRPTAIASFVHSLSVQSSFFSPCGSHIATCSFDNHVRVWKNVLDAPAGPSSVSPLVVKHNNQTGRWITTFKAVWMRDSSGLIVGSMDRGIDYIDPSNGALYPNRDAALTAIPSVNAVHPSRDIFVSGNASGRAVLWSQARSM